MNKILWSLLIVLNFKKNSKKKQKAVWTEEINILVNVWNASFKSVWDVDCHIIKKKL